MPPDDSSLPYRSPSETDPVDTPPPPRSVRTWLLLLLIWGFGLGVWAIYIGALLYVFFWVFG